MNLQPCLVIVASVALPPTHGGQGSPEPSACRDCAYWHQSFKSAFWGECVHAQSDHAGDLVPHLSACTLLSPEYDPTQDIHEDASMTIRR